LVSSCNDAAIALFPMLALQTPWEVAENRAVASFPLVTEGVLLTIDGL
jgi:hypothetical protein